MAPSSSSSSSSSSSFYNHGNQASSSSSLWKRWSHRLGQGLLIVGMTVLSLQNFFMIRIPMMEKDNKKPSSSLLSHNSKQEWKIAVESSPLLDVPSHDRVHEQLPILKQKGQSYKYNGHDNNSNPNTITNDKRMTPTFLFGIPSVQKSLSEKERRKAVRETYLRFYKDLGNTDNDHNNDHDNIYRICSLQDLQAGKAILEQNCQIAYVFFVGGNTNPNGPTELVQPNTSFPMILSSHPNHNDEDDLIYLNIRENLEDGKSQTWFKYASMLVKEENFPFDYIAKVDSDTLVFIPAFIRFVQQTLKLPSRPHNTLVYGGRTHTNKSCNVYLNDSHPCPLPLVGDVYMGGPFYWMSPDLAQFITSNEMTTTRKALSIRHEDVDIGNFIFSHPDRNNITIIKVSGQLVLIHRLLNDNWEFRNRGFTFRGMVWAHSEDGYWPGPFFKNIGNYRKVWRQFQAYWSSGETLLTKDIYHLHELPGSSSTDDFIRINDYIYSNQDFDSSPIVLEKHKLVFFTVAGVGDSTWRCLFRRIMGYPDWQNRSRQFDGLRHLYDYSVSEATTIMTSPDYTRAMFVRDPKLRVLSSFLEHVVKDKGQSIKWSCCGGLEKCVRQALQFEGFLRLIRDCDKPYWRPQGDKMETRFLNLLNFVGHYDSMAFDARRLLEKLGVWNDYGSGGWGSTRGKSIFHSLPLLGEAEFQSYYTPEIEKFAQKLFRADYDAKSILNLTRKVRFERIP